MKTFLGRAPGLNSDDQIENIQSTVKVVAKTTAYTVLARESGTVFTTEGATASVTFTLPTIAAGLHYWFMCSEDFDMVVTGTANLMVAFNDVTATSVSYATSAEKAGCGFYLVCDGTKWLAFCLIGQDSATVTIA
jgi:hypothetical protein